MDIVHILQIMRVRNESKSKMSSKFSYLGWVYHTVEDEAVEVLTEEQHRRQLATYTDYINNFVKVSNVRRNIGL